MRAFSSRGLQIRGRGFAALAVDFNVEGKLLALGEAAHAGTLYRRNMNKHVGTACILLDEAEPSLGIKELHGTCRHIDLLEKHLWACNPHNHSRGPQSGFGVFLREALNGQIARQAKSRMV
jgi:hypothetical protein